MFQRLIRRLFLKFLDYLAYRPNTKKTRKYADIILHTKVLDKGYEWQQAYNKKFGHKFDVVYNIENCKKIDKAKEDLVKEVLNIWQ